MAVPSLALPKSPWTKAFGAIVAILETDPALKAAGVIVRSMRGNGEDVAAIPTFPMIALTPQSRGSSWATEGMHEIPLGIQIDLFIRGTCVDDLMNLGYAVLTALYPANGSARETVVSQLTSREGAGVVIQQITVTGAPLTPIAGDDPVPHLTATGELTLLIWVSTGE